MGEYEDRYPEAYGRGDAAAPSAAPERTPALRQVRDRLWLRRRFGLDAAAETAPAWEHSPSEGARTIEPTPPPSHAAGSYRGIGPRGYVRSPERIYDDICDRLTDSVSIDASGIEVLVNGTQVTLAGSVDSVIALRQAEAIADEVAGVSRVRNGLRVRSAGEHQMASPEDRVNRPIGTTGTR